MSEERKIASQLRLRLQDEVEQRTAAQEQPQVGVLQLQALQARLEEQARVGAAVRGKIQGCGILTAHMMAAFAAEMEQMLKAEPKLEPRVRTHITSELARRVETWRTEAHEIGRQLEFDSNVMELLHSVALSKGALQSKLEDSLTSNNQLQLQLSAERARTPRPRDN